MIRMEQDHIINMAHDMTDLIGRTPLVRLNRVVGHVQATIAAKLEYFNPAGSVKDRIGAGMILAAEREGLLEPGQTIIEPTSGNTGIALAWVAAARGYHLILTMPESMTFERQKLLELLGVKLVLTPSEEGMTGAVNKAKEILAQTPGALMPQQFSNSANPDIHRETTAQEIWDDTAGRVDIVVVGVGTGGTLTGVAQVLKERNPAIQMVAVEPEGSPVLSGGEPGSHRIQGIGPGFIPEILKTELIDDIVQVSDSAAIAMARRLAREEGILAGLSSGATVAAAVQVAKKRLSENKLIVTILADTAERYLSTALFRNHSNAS